MPRAKKMLTATKIQNKLAQIALKVEAGELDSLVGQRLASIWKGALYAIQVESGTTEIKENLERLEIIEKALVTGDLQRLKKLIEERGAIEDE